MQGGARHDMLAIVMTAREGWPGAGPVMLATAKTCLVVALLVGSAAAQRREEGFDATERRRLIEGELVTRPAMSRRGQLRLIGGSAWQVVDRPVAVTWRALCDAENWHRMLPATEDASVVAHRPGQRTVRLRHSAGFLHASYHLQLTYDHGQREISFRLDQQRRNDLRAAWGFLSVRPFEDESGRSLIGWGVMADVGGGMLGGVLRGQVHEWMLRVPETIRTYLHGSGGRRYGADDRRSSRR